MSWWSQVTGQNEMESASGKTATQDVEEMMSPGLTGEYDMELREKAGLRIPPPPPECMGIEGEYDPQGLKKRVALAFDRDPLLKTIETIQIEQQGSTIKLNGQVPNQMLLDMLIQVASRVDGTKAVHTAQVEIHPEL